MADDLEDGSNEQVYAEVMVAFDGLAVGDRALVRADWFAARSQYLKPLMRRRWIGDSDGSGGDLPAED